MRRKRVPSNYVGRHARSRMMAQLPLGVSRLPVRRVVDDFGPVGQGVSMAHYVSAENGTEYIIKGPALTPNHSYVAANELIAATLAGILTLPVLDVCIIEMAGELYFGSAWMQQPTFVPQITSSLFAQCDNRDRVYDILVFDIFVCNVDRHSGNLLVRTTTHARGATRRRLLLMNDHSHCMVLPNESAAVLTGRIMAPPQAYVRLDFARDAIVDPTRLSEAIANIERLTDGQIIGAVQSVPKQFLPSEELGLVMSFLRERRSKLRNIINGNLNVFPQMKGG